MGLPAEDEVIEGTQLHLHQTAATEHGENDIIIVGVQDDSTETYAITIGQHRCRDTLHYAVVRLQN